MPMIEKFLAKDETLAFGLDALGFDCLSFAANNGSESVIHRLLSLGVGPDGSGKQCRGFTPLMSAAWNGQTKCVKLLIKAGADVRKVDGAPWYRNAGHWAASSCQPQSTRILLQAGVDATTRDGLGYSVVDYANMFPEVWRQTRRYLDPASNLLLEDDTRCKGDALLSILRKTMVDCSSATLSLDYSVIENKEWELSNTTRPAEATLTEFFRRQYVACLAHALERSFDLSTNSHVDSILEDACLCFSEVIRSNYSVSHGIWWNSCCICSSNITNACFKCRTCYEIFLCFNCYTNYVKSGRRAPKSFEALKSLEAEVYPVRQALKSLRGNIKLLVESLAALPVVEEWAIRVHSSYNKWNSTYNEFGQFDSEIFGGWNFMDIVNRAFALRQEPLNTARRNKSPEGKLQNVDEDAMEDFVNEEKWVVAGNDLINNFAFASMAELGRNSVGEMDGCKGHEFIELPAWSELSDDQRANFDEHKMLKKEFFQGLLRRYAPEHLEYAPPELDTNRQAEKSVDKADGKTRIEVNWSDATPKNPEHPLRPPSSNSKSKVCTQFHISTSAQSGTDYEGVGDQRNDEGVILDDEDGTDTDDERESMTSIDSFGSFPEDSEAFIADIPAVEMPDVIANQISIVIKSKDHKRDSDSLFARKLISMIAKKAGPWPPVQV